MVVHYLKVQTCMAVEVSDLFLFWMYKGCA